MGSTRYRLEQGQSRNLTSARVVPEKAVPSAYPSHFYPLRENTVQPPDFPTQYLFPFLCTSRKAFLKKSNFQFKILNVLFLTVSQ